jgi:hypothetical protein
MKELLLHVCLGACWPIVLTQGIARRLPHILPELPCCGISMALFCRKCKNIVVHSGSPARTTPRVAQAMRSRAQRRPAARPALGCSLSRMLCVDKIMPTGTFWGLLTALWDPSVSFLGPFWEPCGIVLGAFRGPSGTFWEHSGSIVVGIKQFRFRGTKTGADAQKCSFYRGHRQILTLGLLGTFWRPSGGLLGASWERLAGFCRPSGCFFRSL